MSDFSKLSKVILNLHNTLQKNAIKAVNRTLTVRNWLIGRHIVEYEQNGADRAEYGVGLLESLSEELKIKGMEGISVAALRNCRQFYTTYPHLSDGMNDLLGMLKKSVIQIQQTPSVEFLKVKKQKSIKGISPSPELLIQHFTFSHFVELMRIEEPLKRVFYEIEGIRGCWSVAQLKRQIESLLYERTGLSKDKKGLIRSINTRNTTLQIKEFIGDPYILGFTRFPEQYQFSENDCESALLDNVQSFLLEPGNGFCFEARQKRISIDNEHDRIDLVFYHRILHCHNHIDLKIKKFSHSDAGQMNFYCNYYKANYMSKGDNPPIGLILCTDRDETVVKYATSGMKNNLFVSKYLTQLPAEEQIRKFLVSERERTILKLNEEQAVYGKKEQLL